MAYEILNEKLKNTIFVYLDCSEHEYRVFPLLSMGDDQDILRNATAPHAMAVLRCRTSYGSLELHRVCVSNKWISSVGSIFSCHLFMNEQSFALCNNGMTRPLPRDTVRGDVGWSRDAYATQDMLIKSSKRASFSCATFDKNVLEQNLPSVSERKAWKVQVFFLR